MRIAFAIAAAMFMLTACAGGGSGPVSITTPAATMESQVAALLAHAQGLGSSGADEVEDIRELIDTGDWSGVVRAAHIRAEAAETAGNTDAAAAWTILAEAAAAARAAAAQRRPVADQRIAFLPGTDMRHGHYRTDGLPEPLAVDVKHQPIYRDDSRIFVGIAQAASSMQRLRVYWQANRADRSRGLDLRWGYLSDGNNRAAVVEYLENAAPNGGPSLVRYTEPPVVRIIGKASAREASSVNAAVRLVNASLPEWAKMTIGSPLPGETSTDNLDDEGRLSLSEAGIPENTIFVEFLPCSEWHDGCGSNYAGAAWKNWDSSTKRLIRGLIQVNTTVEETKVGTDREAAILLAHELIHTLGFDHVRAGFASIMHSKEYGGGNFRLSQGGFPQPLSLLYPIDREALRALYGALDPGDSPEALGEWGHSTLHAAGHGEHVAFGVALRNGYAEPWAYGLIPDTDLADNRSLSGSAAWHGRLDGFTPDQFYVTGAAAIGVNLATMAGRADFTDLNMWEDEAWHTWLDGDLRYTIAVRGNTFRETGGDDGRLTGIFAGASHEAAAGTLERSDLTAAFGASR